ncbi:MAG: hypothetical protein V3T92_07355 [Anaerolineae bacterium]
MSKTALRKFEAQGENGGRWQIGEDRRIGAGGDYTIVLKRSGDQYVTLCLELEVAGMGYTPEEALENTRLAIESYLEEMEADSLPPERPVRLNVLHEFLAGEEERKEIAGEKPKLKVLAYA